MPDILVINRSALGYVSAPLLAAELADRLGEDVESFPLRAGVEAPHADSIYIRWGSTHSVANKDAKVLNSAKAIHRGSDKAGFRALCGPLSPQTWFDLLDVPNHEGHFERPVVVRSGRHAGGNNFWLCDNMVEAMEAVEKAGPGYYISLYIPKTHEYRVHCVQGRVVGVSEKHPHDPTAPVWNYHPEDGDERWTNFQWSEWPLDVVRFALAAFAKSRLHFGAVDVMHDGTRPYVLEVNSAPTLSPYRASCYGRGLAYSIARGKLNVGEYEYARPMEINNWKQAAHPGLLEA